MLMSLFFLFTKFKERKIIHRTREQFLTEMLLLKRIGIECLISIDRTIALKLMTLVRPPATPMTYVEAMEVAEMFRQWRIDRGGQTGSSLWYDVFLQFSLFVQNAFLAFHLAGESGFQTIRKMFLYMVNRLPVYSENVDNLRILTDELLETGFTPEMEQEIRNLGMGPGELGTLSEALNLIGGLVANLKRMPQGYLLASTPCLPNFQEIPATPGSKCPSFAHPLLLNFELILFIMTFQLILRLHNSFSFTNLQAEIKLKRP